MSLNGLDHFTTVYINPKGINQCAFFHRFWSKSAKNDKHFP